jgi:ABC-type amino acid transport substrate-binding protein
MAKVLTDRDLVVEFSGTDTATQMFNALTQGQIDGICLDKHLAFMRLSQVNHPERFRTLRLTPESVPESYEGAKQEEYALAVKTSERDTLERYVNPTIREALSSGLVNELEDRFMPKPPPGLDLR